MQPLVFSVPPPQAVAWLWAPRSKDLGRASYARAGNPESSETVQGAQTEHGKWFKKRAAEVNDG